MIIFKSEFPNLEIKKKKNLHWLYYKKREIGFIKNGEFWKIPLDPQKHIYRTWDSVGIEKEILLALERLGIKFINVCWDKQKKEWHKIPLNIWLTLGKQLIYGNHVQLHLSREEILHFGEVRYMIDWKNGENFKTLYEYENKGEKTNPQKVSIRGGGSLANNKSRGEFKNFS